MFDAKRLLDQLVGSGVAGGFAGGLAGGALAKTLTGKKARKFAGSALQLGGLALVGGLAYKAWQNYQRGSAPASPSGGGVATLPSRSAFLPDSSDRAGTNALSLLLARAIISAAKADGKIDAEESQAILHQINGLDLPAEDKGFLFEEYGRPLDLQGLVSAVDSPEHAAEVYAASVLTVAPPSPPEKIYLDSLAKTLGLESGLVNEIHNTVQANRAAA
ncbi:MAG: tellurite resistance TerB family protein [Arenicellales bacterium]|nr:tellurite resistance TerB family protein [Arenicellales bacterium]